MKVKLLLNLGYDKYAPEVTGFRTMGLEGEVRLVDDKIGKLMVARGHAMQVSDETPIAIGKKAVAELAAKAEAAAASVAHSAAANADDEDAAETAEANAAEAREKAAKEANAAKAKTK